MCTYVDRLPVGPFGRGGTDGDADVAAVLLAAPASAAPVPLPFPAFSHGFRGVAAVAIIMGVPDQESSGIYRVSLVSQATP